MIPQRLCLKNFLSYREAVLDFQGLHVACICGENGSGKSSLLEAIAWAVWGQSRAVSEDDVIHLGSDEARVDFTFQYQQQTFRIIRTRHRSLSSSLEFQVQTPQGFRSLTGRGMRATQSLIQQHIKLDYETFVNSAYLRQGRADEFMLKRPSERKQILADLLKLSQYDQLAEQARERSRQFKAELVLLEQSLERLDRQIQQGEGLAQGQVRLEAAIAQLRAQQEQNEVALNQGWMIQQQRQTWQQERHLHQQQHQHLSQDAQRVRQELAAVQEQCRELETVLTEADAIAQGYRYLHSLQSEEEIQTAKFQAHQIAQAEHQQKAQEHSDRLNALTDQLRQHQAQLEILAQQEQDIQRTLSKADDIAVALTHLHHARQRLTQLDQLQLQASPLIQRRQQLQSELDWEQAQLSARLNALDTTLQHLQHQQARYPHIQQAVSDVAAQIDYLEQRKRYQQQVRERGVERRSFMERLQAEQRTCETQIAELDQKIHLLKRQGTIWSKFETSHFEVALDHYPDALLDEVRSRSELITPDLIPSEFSAVLTRPLETTEQALTVGESTGSYGSAYPTCPLCDRPLDEHHWQLVIERHQTERQEVLNQLWVIREQLAVSEREIQVLRQEYREVEKELAQYGATMELRGRLQAQIHNTADVQTQWQHLQIERQTVEQTLQSETYALEIREELHLLDQSLQTLSYDERDHALARGEVDRWRWAEIRQQDINQAQRRQEQLAQRRPELVAAIAQLEHQRRELQQSPLQQELRELERRMADIAYDVQHHTRLRHALRQAQSWELRYRELTQAQQHYPQVQQRLQHLTQSLNQIEQSRQAIAIQIAQLDHQLTETPDPQNTIASLEQALHQWRSQLEQHIAELGRVQQQAHQWQLLQQQRQETQQQIQSVRQNYRVYTELAQAFGKNGIQALMIENILPQLEAETNQVLGRLSANQLHVQFVTQRAGKRSPRRHPPKLIDTLDILISDVQGTRPYETYSGGEAFRVNFAIRLALSRLLAQRAGTPLQLLIIDEGFGTQDASGCSRLISAIQAIAPDFACILTVTHIPHLKEAFQARIEVLKTKDGSKLQLVC